MGEENTHHPAAVDVGRQFRLDWTCDRAPGIASLLERVPPNEQATLFGELLTIELDELEKRGVKRNAWDYYPTFPGLRRAIDQVFQARRPMVDLDTSKDLHGTNPASLPAVATPLSEVDSGDSFRSRYKLLERLGGGAFGEVYRATDTELERDVAIKMLRVKHESLESILHEARLAARVHHPAIVAVYDLVRTMDGSGCIVMEYVEGSTLARLIETRNRPMSSIVAMLSIVADALKLAHKNGLVHRDLKPENILIDAHDSPHIVDFGLALHESEQPERIGEFAGTPCYMSPEQIRGEANLLDGRCDIWALGVILYEALTGRKPFNGRTRTELYAEIASRAPRPPRMIDNSLPESIERICLKCLSKDISGRYTNAGDLAKELKAAYPSGPQESTSEGSSGLLHATWEMLDPDLQDAFSLAYNKKRRIGSNRISTRDLFQALMRIQNNVLVDLIDSLPPGAMPEPIDPQLTPDEAVIREEPLLSDCVSDSLRAFREVSDLPRKLSPTDLFVDIGKHGHGPSVRQLREHGVTSNDFDSRVEQLGISVLKRTQ